MDDPKKPAALATPVRGTGSAAPGPVLLPLAHEHEPRPERRDAVRNRRRILAAADRLFRERGVANVSMDDIAEAAGVGKGTLYRRFQDRSALSQALLDEEAAALQEELLRGEPPLGPGAPPDERLKAFFAALAELHSSRLDVVVDSEARFSGARFRGHVYAAWHLHVSVLLRELDPSLDAGLLAHALLAPLAADLLAHMRGEGHETARLVDGMALLVDGVVASARARQATLA